MEMDTFESRELYRRAEIQINRGRFREASALLTHALKISPDNPVYISYLGYCIGMLGNIEGGVKIIINCDAHHPDDFDNLHFGVATANRGWATAGDIANTRSLEEFLALVKPGE